jgi:hypothetical protein
MKTTAILTALVYFVALLSLLFLIAWWIIEYGKKTVTEAQEYEKQFVYCDDLIEFRDKTKENYDLIENELLKLGQMKYKDKERTSVLTCKFWRMWGVNKYEK